jgi:transposase
LAAWAAALLKPTKCSIGGVDKRGQDDKAVIFGAIERGGEVVTEVLPSRKAMHIMPAIFKWVRPVRASQPTKLAHTAN